MEEDVCSCVREGLRRRVVESKKESPTCTYYCTNHTAEQVSHSQSKGKELLKVTCPEGNLLGTFAKWKWLVGPCPDAVMEVAIASVGSFIPAMAGCPSETSHGDIILTATLPLTIAE